MQALGRRLVSAAVGVCLCVPTTAFAAPSRFGLENPEASAHADAAAAAANVKDYDTALRHLKAAYAIEPNPVLLYAWAQAERLAGHYRASIPLYEEFLEQNPDSEIANKALANLMESRARAEEMQPLPDPVPTEVAGEDPEDTDPEGASHREPPDPDDDADDVAAAPTLKDEKLAPILLGIGAAVAITGGVVLGVGRSRVASSPDAPTEDAYFEELEGARPMYYGGLGVLGAGALLMVGGAVRYIVVAKRGKKPKTSASAMVMPTGIGLSWSGRF